MSDSIDRERLKDRVKLLFENQPSADNIHAVKEWLETATQIEYECIDVKQDLAREIAKLDYQNMSKIPDSDWNRIKNSSTMQIKYLEGQRPIETGWMTWCEPTIKLLTESMYNYRTLLASLRNG